MADYNKWPKEELIKRVKQLEAQLGTSLSDPATVPESRTAPTPTPASTARSTPTSTTQPAKKKQKKHATDIDPAKYATRFIALKLAYIGKNYNGFEYQACGTQSTIEEELWKALVRARLVFPNPDRPNEIDWTVCDYSKCGRTDRGVSAFGQVVALRIRSNKLARRNGTQTQISPEDDTRMKDDANEVNDDYDDAPLPVEQEIQYPRILNRLLPPDIKIYAWAPSPPPDFSARFSCRERQYRYFFTQPAFSPLPNFLDPAVAPSASTAKTAGVLPNRPKDGWLDIEAMRRAAKCFEGLHDFRNFCKIDPSKQITNFTRRVFEADVVEVDGLDTSLPYLSGEQFRNFQQQQPPPCTDNTKNTSLSAETSTNLAPRTPKVYYFHVRGSAFLWHQIRCMVAILFLIGQGLEPVSLVSTLLDTAKQPCRPNYVLADDAPLVLWDCLFGRDKAHDGPDEVDWVYVGADSDSPINLHGGALSLTGELWAYWRDRKMDEILANRLLDWVSQKTDVHRAKFLNAKSTRVYDGGNSARYIGGYLPVMKKAMIPSPEQQNDRFAQRNGFKDAEAMRASGNWREVIRAEKLGISAAAAAASGNGASVMDVEDV
ncbi:pseudouridine synthase [Coniella lustricola]|uniref:Pseudouridine synthase n=1 Tax=Coniella lustricola TaxID=2025994 RepID=A0A2T3A927_9PEZI|nr:pseudouridine synthase [Coniella lustricola]